eukprot:06093.XXX_220527_220697_1 [CDS] Oithona nana genome sequencing.
MSTLRAQDFSFCSFDTFGLLTQGIGINKSSIKDKRKFLSLVRPILSTASSSPECIL